MPICRECNTEFPNRIIHEGKERVVHKRTYCLNCLPFGSGRKPYKTKIQTTQSKSCSECQTVKPLSQFYKYKNKNKYQGMCKNCQKSKTKQRIQDFKIKCVEYKGGKCIDCGYKKYIGALEFHHRDPNKKDFKISDTRTRQWDKVIKELDKCDLLCSNCHKETHYMNGLE